MALRPAMAKWFELLIARDELSAALESLADTGAVELQAHSDTAAAVLLPALRAALDEYKRLWRRYGQYWPEARREPEQKGREAQDVAATALRRLRAWTIEADPLIDRLEKLARERSELGLLEGLLSQSHGELPDLQLFAQAGPVLASRACLFPSTPRALGVPPAVLALSIASGQESYLLAVGSAEQVGAFDDTLGVHNARRFALPPALPAARDAALVDVRARLLVVASESQALAAKLGEISRAHGLSAAIADLELTAWLVQNVPPLAFTEHFAWVTGWTSDLSGGRLQAALDRAHRHYLLRFPDAPKGLIQPVVLHNPRWVQPFELFSRLLGMPSASEADPSRLLAFVAPVMFGFMFADVGQGIVLIIAGTALRKRFPATVLLIPGGIAAALFGLLFGSVFASEQILPAIWLRPLHRPLVMLEASLVFGACVILLGLALDAVQHHWSGNGAKWWASSAGLTLGYVAMICAPFDSRALWALAAGLGWYLAGSAMLAQSNRLSHLGAAAGEALEGLLQLAINTVSFVRIGAFALAHAGLGSAVVALAAILGTAAGARPAAWIMLIIGNALIITIEGLVVGIQTTRLVLFEFFIRFLHGSGRPFRPLPVPAALDLHSSSRTSP
jgi:V/A-type H+-transporting ATPase subunit I